jgi:hypothetical protein
VQPFPRWAACVDCTGLVVKNLGIGFDGQSS